MESARSTPRPTATQAPPEVTLTSPPDLILLSCLSLGKKADRSGFGEKTLTTAPEALQTPTLLTNDRNDNDTHKLNNPVFHHCVNYDRYMRL
eukprot:scaffold580087_cov18-Prasinocladus_malaysianus.AAC.1